MGPTANKLNMKLNPNSDSKPERRRQDQPTMQEAERGEHQEGELLGGGVLSDC